MQAKTSDSQFIEKYISFTRELGRFPVEGEIRRKAREDLTFHSHSAFRRFGGKHKPIDTSQRTVKTEAATKMCWHSRPDTHGHTQIRTENSDRVCEPHEVRLYYEIGRTNSVGRRSSERAIMIPVPPTTIHSIETDDPVGVEAYWHRRFADKRAQGEWFALSSEDIKTFKRWRKIV